MNSDEIKQRLHLFSFPRLMGTPGEKEIQTKFFQELKQLGIKPHTEPFDYHFGLVKSQQLLFFLIFTYELIILIIRYFFHNLGSMIYIWIILLFWTILIVICLWIIKNLKQFQPIELESNIKQSKNIIGELKSKKNKEFEMSMGLVLLVAHYDSISRRYADKRFQRFFYSIRVILFIDLIITPIYGILLLTISNLNNQEYFYIIQIILSIILIIGLIFLIRNLIQNASPGMCDNASGLTTILNLINRIKTMNYQPEWLDIQVLFCGAEELGNFGSRKYIATHNAELARYKTVYVLNLDFISTPLTILDVKQLKKSNESNKLLTNLIIHESNRLKIPLKIKKILANVSNRSLLPPASFFC